MSALVLRSFRLTGREGDSPTPSFAAPQRQPSKPSFEMRRQPPFSVNENEDATPDVRSSLSHASVSLRILPRTAARPDALPEAFERPPDAGGGAAALAPLAETTLDRPLLLPEIRRPTTLTPFSIGMASVL